MTDATTRTRVLHLVLNLHQGGLERVVGDLLRHADRGRFETHVLALEFLGDLAQGLDAFGTLHVARAMSKTSMIWPRSLALDIQRIGPDVVHTHSGVWYKGALAARIARVPFVIHTDHGRDVPEPLVARVFDGLASRRTDLVVAVSDTLGAYLRDRIVSRSTEVITVPNGIDTDRFRPGAESLRLRRSLGVPPDSAVLGSVGRLVPVKCYDLMIEAFAALCRDWVDAAPPHMLIVGDGPERHRLEALAHQLGVSQQVHLLGWRDGVADVHAMLTLFTLSSASEGTSIALLEAMSSGVCPVVTRVGGNERVLGPALGHRLVEPGDAVALRDAWRSALRNAAERQRDASAARARVMDYFSVHSMVQAYESAYSRAPSVRGRTL